jgi:hypothetical protein
MNCRSFSPLAVFATGLVWISLAAGPASGAVVINEIHYHPVERPAFTADGSPVLDLSDDVHEFVELFNPGPTNVPLAGWRLSGDIDYEFPASAVLNVNRYLVIAKDPARLLAVSQYGLGAASVLGPFQRQLSNRNGAVRLRGPGGDTVDAVSFSAEFPWAISADALGAEDEWIGLNSSNYQYRGRSLERVSVTWPANDPANWLASPLPGTPSPGRANAVTLAVPRPVVTAFSVVQTNDDAMTIGPGQPARLDVVFSATNLLSAVTVEYFLDDINSTTEPRTTLALAAVAGGNGLSYTGVLPGQAGRSVVRFRMRANRGGGVETVSPRADDPFAWHAYFVAPARASTNRIYDCFISAASLNTLATNLFVVTPTTVDTAHFRRVTQPDPPGVPRASWNATEPAIFVFNGEVYDARARYHGSQYRRSPDNNSWKWQFPRYKRFEDREGLFISDNLDETVVCHALYRLAALPSSHTRWIDFYLNNNAVVRRLDQDEMDDRLVERFAAEQALANPGAMREGVGEFYKSQGNFLFQDPWGPFGYGGYRLLPARPPWWTELQRYEQTYGLQMHGWKGHQQFMELLRGLWAARGDSPTAVNPNLPALRAFLTDKFDVDAVLTSTAIRVWSGGWDNFNHNHFLWRRANGKWATLQWDFDGELDTAGFPNHAASSIYSSEFGAPLVYSAFSGGWVDANWINDSFFKAFREQYKRKLFILNNTLLHPTNLAALGFGSFNTFATARFAFINSQLGLGAFRAPLEPANLAPAHGAAVLPGAVLQSSPYRHGQSPAPRHASTTWTIRSANGAYAAPVFKTTSTSNLTTLPIPFDRLTFGETYLWRCLHTDTNGHPSVESRETAFVFGADPVLVSLIALDAATEWRYLVTGPAPPADWASPGFDDSSWAAGPALIGDDAPPLVEPLRTPFARGSRVAFHFRKSFDFTSDLASTSLRLRHVVDDGVVIYLNGVEVVRTGMPAGPVSPTTLAARNVINAVYEGPFIIPTTSLVQGANWLAAEVHRISSGSADVVFGVALDAAVPPAPGAVVLNEVLAENRGAAAYAGTRPDYLELFNTSDMPQSLNGMSLSDNVERPGKFSFPPGVTLGPSESLVIWCDDQTNAPGLHTGFALDNDGQTLALFVASPNGYQVSDAVTFGLQAPDLPIGRVPDGAGPWVLNTPTPGGANMISPTASAASLKINEWMASDAGGPDWFEVYNPAPLPVALGGLYLTDNLADPTNTRIPPLSFIAAGGHRQFLADSDPGQSARHVDFRLSSSGERINLYDSGLNLIDAVVFGPQTSGVSEGRLPDGASNFVFFPTTASPDEPNYLPLVNVVINEVLTHSDPPFEDAVELFNPTGADADIGGWWLSDSKTRARKFQFPAPTRVPANGYLVVYENQFNSAPGAPASFALDSARGEGVYLTSVGPGDELTGFRAGAEFGPAETGVSHGRFGTSQGVRFGALAARTFGADNPADVAQFRTGAGLLNAGPKVGPVVISEIQYRPQDHPDGSDNDLMEYLELKNITDAAVDLFDPGAAANRWSLRDAVDFTFPPQTTLQPQETVLVVGFDPVTNATALAGFRATYAIDPAVRLFGPWRGKLDNSSDRVELFKPGPPVSQPGPDFGYVPSILVDHVRYADNVPWPAEADGTGQSLQRRLNTAYGDDPANWFASGLSAGTSNAPTLPPTISLLSPVSNAVFNAFSTVQLEATASDADGAIRQVDFFADGVRIGAATNFPWRAGWSNAALGIHLLSARAIDDRYGYADAAPITVRLTNGPPLVSLTSPTSAGTYVLPTNILLQAAASDPDGAIARVEFYDNDVKLGEATTSPYAWLWTSVRAGAHTLAARATDIYGLSATSSVAITVTRTRFVAYVVPPGTVGAQAVGNSLGMDFEVRTQIVVSALGMFDSGSDGVLSNATLTAQIWRRSGNTGTLLAATNFTTANPGALVGGSRFKPLSSPLVLSNGSYTLVAYGFTSDNPHGAALLQTRTWTTDSGGGLLAFVGPSRFGAAGAFPASQCNGVDNCSTLADGFAASTFEFLLYTARPLIVYGPTNTGARAGTTAQFTVAAVGQTPLYYQWFFNGAPLAGRTGSTLVLSNVQPANEGGYSVVVSNAAGVTTTGEALLSVYFNPVFVQGLVSQTVPVGALATFSVVLTNNATLPLSYEWRRGSLLVASNISNERTEFLVVAASSTVATQGIRVIVRNAAAPTGAFNSVAGLITLMDADADGLPDEWENAFNLNPASAADALLDADGDGLTNGEEYLAGTDPADDQSHLKVEILGGTGGATLTFGAISSRTYTVQYSDDLPTVRWTKLGDMPARATNYAASLFDPAATTNRFYRVATPRQP